MNETSTASTAARALLLVVAAWVLRASQKGLRFERFEPEALLVPYGLFWVWVGLMVLVLGDFDLGLRARLEAGLLAVGSRLASLPTPGQRVLRGLAVLFLCAQIGGLIVDRASKTYYGTDGLLFSRYAVDLLLSGENPYAHSMAPASDAYAFGALRTAQIDGTLVESFSYPAMAIWWFVPQSLLGIESLDVTPLLVLLVTALLFTAKSHWSFCWAPALMFSLHSGLRFYSGGGVFDILWVLPLMGSMSAWTKGKTGVAGVWLGIACAVKQTPWLVAPFLLIWALREGGRSKALALVFGAVTSFIAINLPFIVMDPVAWFYGVLTPLAGRTSLVGQGEGLVLLRTFALVDWPKSTFSLLMLCVLVLCLVLYAAKLPRVRWLGWVAPAVTLWFAWRSLHNYYVFWIPVAYWAVLLRGRRPFERGAAPVSAVKPVAAVCVLATVLLVIPPPTVPWEPRWLRATDRDGLGRASELSVELIHRGTGELDPIFSLVHSRFQTVMHWERTPDAPLGPGETRVYTLRAPSPDFAIPPGADVHLQVRHRGESPAASLRHRAPPMPRPLLVNGAFAHPKLTHRGVVIPWGWELGWSPQLWPWTSSLSPAAMVSPTPAGMRLALDDSATIHRERSLSLKQRTEKPVMTLQASWARAQGAFVEVSAGGETVRFSLEGEGSTEFSVVTELTGDALERYRDAGRGEVRFGVEGEGPVELTLQRLTAAASPP